MPLTAALVADDDDCTCVADSTHAPAACRALVEAAEPHGLQPQFHACKCTVYLCDPQHAAAAGPSTVADLAAEPATAVDPATAATADAPVDPAAGPAAAAWAIPLVVLHSAAQGCGGV